MGSTRALEAEEFGLHRVAARSPDRSDLPGSLGACHLLSQHCLLRDLALGGMVPLTERCATAPRIAVIVRPRSATGLTSRLLMHAATAIARLDEATVADAGGT